MSPGRDTEGHAAYSAGGTFNTGILFIRANALKASERFSVVGVDDGSQRRAAQLVAYRALNRLAQ